MRVGKLDGKDLFMKSKGKLNRNDDIVKTGVGEHVPKKFKEKGRQRDKNKLREFYR